MMFVENVLIRPISDGYVTISWTSDSADMLSWVFINGALAVGPFMAETTDRTVTLPVPTDKTFVVEVHDFGDSETVPTAIAQKPLVKPLIAWNSVETAISYHVYHTIFDTGELAVPSQLAPGYAVAHETESVVRNSGSIESLLLEVPALGMERMEIDCPVILSGNRKRSNAERFDKAEGFCDGTAGSWHSFRVESVDQFGNESKNHIVAHFAADLPPVPELSISRDIETGNLTFRIL